MCSPDAGAARRGQLRLGVGHRRGARGGLGAVERADVRRAGLVGREGEGGRRVRGRRRRAVEDRRDRRAGDGELVGRRRRVGVAGSGRPRARAASWRRRSGVNSAVLSAAARRTSSTPALGARGQRALELGVRLVAGEGEQRGRVERDLGVRAGDDRRLGRGRGPRSSTRRPPGPGRPAGAGPGRGPRRCAGRPACRRSPRGSRPRCRSWATSQTVIGAPSIEHWKIAAGIVGGELERRRRVGGRDRRARR